MKKILVLLLSMLVMYLSWPMQLEILNDPYSVVLEDKNGELLSAQIAQDGQWRFPIMDNLPKQFINCITAYEDQRFFHHFGVDPIAMIRAIAQNLRANKVVSGASTISMQLIRMSRRNPDRNLVQKVIETFQAIKLEWKYSKNEILNMYAAHAPFGGNVVGLETASWKYYNKKPEYLSWAQMATLCVLPNAPSLVRFDKNRDRLLEKRNFLLSKLYRLNMLTELDLQLALSEDLENERHELPRHAPHLLSFAKKDGNSGRISTTVNMEIQKGVNNIMNQHHSVLSQKEIHNGAVIILNTKNSEIISYAGNTPNTQHESSVDMIQAKRSSGSILKPLLYASMLDEGIIMPESFIRDVPIFIDGFSPSNYDRSYSGVIPVSEALSKSLNIPFVLLLQQYGVEKFRRKLNSLGLKSIHHNGDHYGLSLILGGAEVKLVELVTTYAHMGRQLYEYDINKGRYSSDRFAEAYYCKKNADSFGLKSEKGLNKEPYQSFRAGSVHYTFDAMQKLSRPNEFGSWEMFASSRKLAWKTGTSYGHRDAWAIGITPEYTIGVWVGNADGEGRDDIVGVSTAGNILFDVLDILPRNSSWFSIPFDDMDQTEVCAITGMLPSVHCLEKDINWINSQSIKSGICQYHESIWTNETGDWKVDRSCFPHEQSVKKSFLVLPPLVSKYYKRNHQESDMPPLHPSCQRKQESQMQLVYPFQDERIFIPRDFDDERQKIIAQLEHEDPSTQVFWYLNEDYLGTTKDFHTMSMDSEAGDYVLQCIDQNGQNIMRRFEIVGE